jgi:hypothetical protein
VKETGFSICGFVVYREAFHLYNCLDSATYTEEGKMSEKKLDDESIELMFAVLQAEQKANCLLVEEVVRRCGVGKAARFAARLRRVNEELLDAVDDMLILSPRGSHLETARG